MAHQEAIISTNAAGEPEIGPEIPTVLRKVMTQKRRALIGWNHQTDTPNGLCSGKVWCWVSEDDRLQIYDENFNRSQTAGEVRFCGVANFTMVRMFHPYWSIFGRVPKDMNSKDKKRCRRKYRQLIRQWRINNNLPVDDDPENEIQPTQPDGPRRRKRGRPSKRSKEGAAPETYRQRNAALYVTGREEQLAGYALTNPRMISDDEDSDWNDNIPLLQRTRLDTKINQTLARDAEGDVKHEDGTHDADPDTNALDLRAQSIHTPLLNPVPDQTNGVERQPQADEDGMTGLIQIDDDDFQIDRLRSALGEHLNESNQENIQGTIEDDTAATMVEDVEVKRDKDKEVTLVPCQITPINEVIVIGD